MLAQLKSLKAAVLSGVTASLLIATSAPAAQPERPVVVYADPQEDFHTERVAYADLDLANEAGQRTLLRRVGSAVKEVCSFEPGLPVVHSYHRCVHGAWNGANPQIAQAVARAKEIALTGKSSIAATAITIKAVAN